MRFETFIWKDSPNMFDEFADLFNKAKTVTYNYLPADKD